MVIGAFHAGKAEGRAEAKKELEAQELDMTDVYVHLMKVWHSAGDLDPVRAMTAKVAADKLMEHLQQERANQLLEETRSES
jgi:hypothetical protein